MLFLHPILLSLFRYLTMPRISSIYTRRFCTKPTQTPPTRNGWMTLQQKTWDWVRRSAKPSVRNMTSLTQPSRPLQAGPKVRNLGLRWECERSSYQLTPRDSRKLSGNSMRKWMNSSKTRRPKYGNQCLAKFYWKNNGRNEIFEKKMHGKEVSHDRVKPLLG